MKQPTPPRDLWEQLDALRHKNQLAPPPEDAFTTKQYGEKYGVKQSTAEEQLRKLCASGAVKRIGLRGRDVYYQLA